METAELKNRVCRAIDEHAAGIIRLAEAVAAQPELGFKEHKTAAKVAAFLQELGYSCREGLALTGVRAELAAAGTGPNIAVLGELDAVICPDSEQADPLTGAAHTCGHHLQLAAMAGAALGLKLADAAAELSGRVTFMAVPAEEFVEIAYRQKLREEGRIHFLGGKQELIYRGEFDDIDMAMMVHSQKNAPQPLVAIGESSNGFIGKTIRYIGREAHAAEAPQEGVNALNAAMLGLMGIHALRETFYEQDIVRVHPIITKGGDLVNTVPADVRLETYVRAKTMAAIDATHRKVDQALAAGGLAVGAETVIHTIPGYLPLDCREELNSLFSANAARFLPPERLVRIGHFSASTDMGDVSQLMPAIHPYVGGVDGALHTRQFKVINYQAAAILPAKLLAMTVIDLLAEQAQQARRVLAGFTPKLTKQQYIALLQGYFS
ncbi:MAG: amidohydrolase [Sporomusaceae bacterium]|nr:amidohydrolase [Sporomusaceae bacterium]